MLRYLCCCKNDKATNIHLSFPLETAEGKVMKTVLSRGLSCEVVWGSQNTGVSHSSKRSEELQSGL